MLATKALAAITMLLSFAVNVDARYCFAGGIKCEYDNGGTCYKICYFGCKCPAEWNGGANNKSGCDTYEGAKLQDKYCE